MTSSSSQYATVCYCVVQACVMCDQDRETYVIHGRLNGKDSDAGILCCTPQPAIVQSRYMPVQQHDGGRLEQRLETRRQKKTAIIFFKYRSNLFFGKSQPINYFTWGAWTVLPPQSAPPVVPCLPRLTLHGIRGEGLAPPRYHA